MCHDGAVSRVNPHPLPSHDLAAFVAAVEAKSIQDAATVLRLTQSAVTKRVRALERRLGVVLLERGRFGVVPTDAGLALYPMACGVLRALDRAEHSMDGASLQQHATLNLAASHTIGEFLLPEWLAQFARSLHSIRPQVELLGSPDVVKAVRSHDVEIGFIEHDEPLHDLETLNLCADEVVAVVAPDHKWASGTSVSAQELEDEPFLTPFLSHEATSRSRSVALSRLGSHGIRLRPVYAADSTEGLKRAVRSGGFTLISCVAAAAETEHGMLRMLHVEGVDLKRELRAIRHVEAATDAGEGFWAWLEHAVVSQSDNHAVF
jgi:DNA-binding transcriptional LysR family regulator